MIPSDRINQHLQAIKGGPLPEQQIQRVAQAIANAMDEEHKMRVAAEVRLLEVLLTLLGKVGHPVNPMWLQDLQDLRGKTRLVNPQGDPLLTELMQLIAGSAQEHAQRAQALKDAQARKPHLVPK